MCLIKEALTKMITICLKVWSRRRVILSNRFFAFGLKFDKGPWLNFCSSSMRRCFHMIDRSILSLLKNCVLVFIERYLAK